MAHLTFRTFRAKEQEADADEQRYEQCIETEASYKMPAPLSLLASDKQYTKTESEIESEGEGASETESGGER